MGLGPLPADKQGSAGSVHKAASVRPADDHDQQSPGMETIMTASWELLKFISSNATLRATDTAPLCSGGTSQHCNVNMHDSQQVLDAAEDTTTKNCR